MENSEVKHLLVSKVVHIWQTDVRRSICAGCSIDPTLFGFEGTRKKVIPRLLLENSTEESEVKNASL